MRRTAGTIFLTLVLLFLLTACWGGRDPNILVNFTHTPEQPHVGQPVTFDASSSYHLDGQIVAWHWAFEEGVTATGLTTTHTFSTPGDHAVRLTVVDDTGAEASTNHTITVRASPDPGQPVARFTATPDRGDAPLEVSFDASNSTGDITSFTWDFGDGSTATGAQPTHTYTDPDRYTVRLTVETGTGATDSTERTVRVTDPDADDDDPPDEPGDLVARFTAAPQQGVAPLTVSFDASGSTGDITSYSWTFGDGDSGDGMTATHSYEEAKRYEVTLTVRDSEGLEDTTTETVQAGDSQPPPPPTLSR